ncbi:MAG: Holliday junction resolvase RuvX [Rhodospirillaceae bacterium]|nr:Holliday junction resolvase RuvX [Rhodospirillaceae bacterium]OUT77070.1 MAG: Holliday junction resolvase RuvX [Rhodospirillaceae bacterium TMED23]|tara:strand:- start:2720 stop:3142 length:423 start_codon:yes stop_codon:yes gene_type:complete
MGLDVGSKTIGLSLSNSDLNISLGIDTIKRKKFRDDLKRLSEIINNRSVGGLVIGLPISMDGIEGRACQSIRQFGYNIIEQISIGITFWDERLSTSAVERFLIKDLNMTRNKRSEVIDKLAATYILQGALDALNQQKQIK